MKALATVTLSSILVLLGIAAYMQFLRLEPWDWSWSAFVNGPPTLSDPPPAPIPAKESIPPPKGNRKTVKTQERLARHDSAAVQTYGDGEEPAPETKPTAPAPVAAAPTHRFPSGDDVPAGLDRHKLLDEFGEPSIRTRSVDKDHLIETYVYISGDRGTHVTLRDGRVLAARTTTF